MEPQTSSNYMFYVLQYCSSTQGSAMNQKAITLSPMQTHNKQTRLQTTLIYQQLCLKTPLARKI